MRAITSVVPGRERHDQCDRPVGITLCPDDALKGQLRARARGQVQESTTVKHTKLPALQVSAAYHDAKRRKAPFMKGRISPIWQMALAGLDAAAKTLCLEPGGEVIAEGGEAVRSYRLMPMLN